MCENEREKRKNVHFCIGVRKKIPNFVALYAYNTMKMKNKNLSLIVAGSLLFVMAACSDSCRCYEVTEKCDYKTYDKDHEDGEEHESRYIYYKWATPQALRYFVDERKVELTRDNKYNISITKKKVKESWQNCEAHEKVFILDGDTISSN